MNKIIVANWKMHPLNARMAKVLASATKKAIGTTKGLLVIIAPPSVFLRDIAKGNKGNKVAYAAQYAHFESEGAHTGEISMPMVRDTGAAYILVGHAERRAMGETNDDTRKQVAAAISSGLKPILCVGEKVRDEEGDYLEGFAQQLLTGLADVPKNKLKEVLIAYEPVWAIGGEESMTPNSMHEMSLYIRKVLMEPFGRSALSIPILYGGSINEASAKVMLEEGEVQGLLVGRVSINPARFAALIKTIR